MEMEIGICSELKEKKQWNESCKKFHADNTKIRAKPYMICNNCQFWTGKYNFAQSKFEIG